ncbi:MAG: hypothetical protein GDA36_06525 [Rhodobacteraceae bacterium]|nr:hypothetical protein [Paracoccaceae bacterium]
MATAADAGTQTGFTSGTEFRVSAKPLDFDYNSSVTRLSDGSFVVTWRSADQDRFYGDGIYGQRFAADGTPAETQFRVNAEGIGYYSTIPLVTALSDSGFVVTWSYTWSYNDDGGREIYARVFSPVTSDGGAVVGKTLTPHYRLCPWRYLYRGCRGQCD